MNKVRKIIKKWWTDWAKFDFMVLGAGALVLLYIAYVLYRSKNPKTESPYFDLWSDFGMVFLGAWLSVRLIDRIIQAREKRHSSRIFLWRNLIHIRSISQKLLPRIYDFDVLELKNELMWANERDPYRKKYFDKSELDKYQDVLAELTNTIKEVEALQRNRREISIKKANLSSKIEEVNESRSLVEDAIRQIHFHDYNDGSFMETAQKLFGLLEQYNSAFSINELTSFEQITRQIKGAIDKTDSLELLIDKPHFQRIYEHE
jgi:hypothetical protein